MSTSWPVLQASASPAEEEGPPKSPRELASLETRCRELEHRLRSNPARHDDGTPALVADHVVLRVVARQLGFPGYLDLRLAEIAAGVCDPQVARKRSP